ncbi:MAG TPA: 4Fe-4S dicluster domain-containing protein [bacterium]|nr:4Fe-4S dicluster domain-containing protein [bacterium]
MKRRDFIKTLGVFSLLIFTGGRFIFRKKRSDIIRPPGTVDEDDFNYKCVRCGKCILACPSKCLKPFPAEKGIVEWGTPFIVPRDAGCIMCLNCASVCPSSAIVKVKKGTLKIGTAEINSSICLVWQHQKDCLVCQEYCPVGAIYTDGEGRPIVDPDICIGCGLCEQNCPVKGESAIRITNKGEKRYSLKEKRYR